jgi:hypothetical protein
VNERGKQDTGESQHAALERALRALASADLDPLRARAQYVASAARLRYTRPAVSWWERREPLALLTLAGVQLLWMLARVVALAF